MMTFAIGVVSALLVLVSIVGILYVKRSVNKSFAFSLNEISFTEEDVMYDLVYRKTINRDNYK